MILIETYSNPVHDLPTDTLIAPLFVSLPVPLHCVQGELDMTNMDVALNMEALVQNRGGARTRGRASTSSGEGSHIRANISADNYYNYVSRLVNRVPNMIREGCRVMSIGCRT